MLGTYCDAVAKYQELNGLIDEHGYTEYNAAGSKQVSSYVKRHRAMLGLFLLIPASSD
ncbi:hypothetical protein [Paenibacillus silviterrae]|uniref:hypothetical protein n=1 Tax=Paenibacillus silviterrae TaxID=3242194 RepID=UPI002542CD42|nr:hypothetical protein [Paenibacillus chinjuensis]